MENDRFQTEKTMPLCKFGPGGDYQQALHPEDAAVTPSGGNAIGKLLDIIASMAGLSEESELNIESEKGDKVENTSTIPQTNRGVTGNRGLHGQETLFADDKTAGSNSFNKPNHRVRTHRRASRKRISRSFHRQRITDARASDYTYIAAHLRFPSK